MSKSRKITKAYEALPKLLKIVLQIFFGIIIGGVYRIIRFLETGNIISLVVGILVLVTGIGNVIIWIVDLITEILFDRIIFFA